jgi:hypothetical protein
MNNIKQCCGSATAWICVILRSRIRIRIRVKRRTGSASMSKGGTEYRSRFASKLKIRSLTKVFPMVEPQASNLAAWRTLQAAHSYCTCTSQRGVNSKRGTSFSPPCLFGSKLKITMALKTKTSSIRELKYRQGDDKNFLWICCYMHRLLYLNLKIFSSAQLSYFSDILHAFVEIMYYLLEPKGGGGGRSLGLFYCLNLSDVYI